MQEDPDPQAHEGRPDQIQEGRPDRIQEGRPDRTQESRPDQSGEGRSERCRDGRPAKSAPGRRARRFPGGGLAAGPVCEPPPPPDFLGRGLFAGARAEADGLAAAEERNAADGADVADGAGDADGAGAADGADVADGAGDADSADDPGGPVRRPPELVLLALLRRSRAPLRSLFRHLGIGVEDAEDLVQEALLIVTARWREIKEPYTFLLGTVRNLGLMHRRRQQGERQARFELGQVEPAAAGAVPQRQVDCQLDARQLLARLPEPSRRIVEMRYGEELSSRDVALALDCSAAGVRQSARRGLRRLRRYAAASPHSR
jgi:RNA polymerase sigma factor (sigma-70 family)